MHVCNKYFTILFSFHTVIMENENGPIYFILISSTCLMKLVLGRLVPLNVHTPVAHRTSFSWSHSQEWTQSSPPQTMHSNHPETRKKFWGGGMVVQAELGCEPATYPSWVYLAMTPPNGHVPRVKVLTLTAKKHWSAVQVILEYMEMTRKKGCRGKKHFMFLAWVCCPGHAGVNGNNKEERLPRKEAFYVSDILEN